MSDGLKHGHELHFGFNCRPYGYIECMSFRSSRNCIRAFCIFTELISETVLIFQEHVNEIDFDYMEYARQRFEQYWLRKPALLGSLGTTPDVVSADGNYPA